MATSLPGRRLRALLGVGLTAALLAPAAASADVDGWTFEPPKFTVGTINGQQNWMKTGPFDHAVASNPPALQPTFGSQSFRISNAVTSGSFGDQTFTDSLVDSAGETTSVNGGLAGGVRQTTFVYSFDFTSADPSGEQAGLVVGLAPDRGDGGRQTSLQLLDTPTGLQVKFFDVPVDPGPGGTADFVEHVVATGLNRTTVHSVRVQIVFNDGIDNDVASVSVDGGTPFVGETWENYYRRDPEQAGGGNKVPTTDSMIFRTGGTAAPGTSGKGFLIDNLRIESLGGPNGQGLQGPQGEQGEQGQQGVQGQAGQAGQAGAAGTNGTNGTNGAPGANGLPGASAPLATTESVPVTIAGSALRASRTGVVKVPITCPASDRLCEGTVTLTSGRSELASKRFILRGGTRTNVSLKLSAKALRQLRSRKLKRVTVGVFSRDLDGNATQASRALRIRG